MEVLDRRGLDSLESSIPAPIKTTSSSLGQYNITITFRGVQMTKAVNKLFKQMSFNNDVIIINSDNFKITIIGIVDDVTGERKHFDFVGAHNLVCYGCFLELKNKKATRYQVKKLFRKLMVIILRHTVNMANDVIKGS